MDLELSLSNFWIKLPFFSIYSFAEKTVIQDKKDGLTHQSNQ
jgi:hypothetical protein